MMFWATSIFHSIFYDLFKAHVACTIPLTSGGLRSFRIQVFSRAAFLKPDH